MMRMNQAKQDLEGVGESREIKTKGCDKCKRCPATSEGEWRGKTLTPERSQNPKCMQDVDLELILSE